MRPFGNSTMIVSPLAESLMRKPGAGANLICQGGFRFSGWDRVLLGMLWSFDYQMPWPDEDAPTVTVNFCISFLPPAYFTSNVKASTPTNCGCDR